MAIAFASQSVGAEILFGSTVFAVLRLGIGDSDSRQHKENLMWWIPSLSSVVCPVLGVGVDVGPP